MSEKQQELWLGFIREDKTYTKYYDEFVTETYKLCFTEGRKIRHDRKKKAGFAPVLHLLF